MLEESFVSCALLASHSLSLQVAGQPLSPSPQQSQQGLSPPHVAGSSSQGQALQQPPQRSTVQHTYLPNTWNSFRGYCK